MDNADETLPPPGRLTRRRASVSLPQGLDLLLKIAEYSWQAKPPLNSSFDDLAEAGIADACPSPLPKSRRRTGQITSPNQNHLNYEPVHSESEDVSDYNSEAEGEIESPVEKAAPPTPPTSQRRARGISFDPRGSRFPKKKKGELDDDTEICLKPLAARRNSGIVPLTIEDSNYLKSDPDGDTSDEEGHKDTLSSAPQAANGGIVAFKNRIKTKLHSVPIPRIFHRKKAQQSQYKLQAFVAILFLTIILLVGSIYVIHKEKELQKSYYDRIRFSSKDRRIRVSNQKGRDILNGVLGVNLSKKDKAWPCLEADRREGHTCHEWMNKARLYFTTHQNPEEFLANETSTSLNSLRCYEIFWQSLNTDFELKDCFNLGDLTSGHFYGGGEIPGSNHWPLNNTNVPYTPFLTGNKISIKEGRFEWGRTLRRLFVNSEGAAIQIADDVPLHVSINYDGDKKLCIGSRTLGYDYEAKRDKQAEKATPLTLNYTICTGENAFTTAEFLGHKDIGHGLKHSDVQACREMAQSPLWRILPETINHGQSSESALLNYTDRITALHLSEGYLLLDETWQKRIGDLKVDVDRFPTFAETLNITRRRGFKVALTIQPFFSTQSLNYEEGLGIGESGVWLAEKHPENKNVPALTQYKNWSSVAVLDATKAAAQGWLEEKVSALVEKYRIDGIFVDLGTAEDLPQFYEFSKPLYSSDYSKELLLKALSHVQHVRTIGVSSVVKLPKLPTFVALSPTESSWAGLQSIIPNILTMGVAGFPFIIPGAIGGDFFPSSSNMSYRTSTKDSFRVPDQELYIRWLELVHFLPVVQYSFLPSDYEPNVVEIATNMHTTRKSKLYPYIKKAIDESLTKGLPIIRPLWMSDPTDPNCLKVSDEFTIGGDILVAPVLRPGEDERDIYLPKGIWRNEMDGSPTKGEKWLHHYRVRKDQIPYFTKLSEASDPDLLD